MIESRQTLFDDIKWQNSKKIKKSMLYCFKGFFSVKSGLMSFSILIFTVNVLLSFLKFFHPENKFEKKTLKRYKNPTF